MNPIGKALWFIESHFTREIALDELAQLGGVSRFHLSRAFSAVTGRSIPGYVRGRRLTEAARLLANGAPDILTVALASGYGSHEAFTRAFRDQFGLTPEAVRAQRHVDNLELVEAHMMDQTVPTDFQPTRFEQGGALLIAGLSEHYDRDSIAGIPTQWQRFVPYIGHVPGQAADITYGIPCNTDDAGNMDYVCGVEVTDFSRVPPELTRLRIAPQYYAVFTHEGHISTIRGTWYAIWDHWLPRSGHEVADAHFFERYDARFDPHTGAGAVEIWLPIGH